MSTRFQPPTSAGPGGGADGGAADEEPDGEWDDSAAQPATVFSTATPSTPAPAVKNRPRRVSLKSVMPHSLSWRWCALSTAVARSPGGGASVLLHLLRSGLEPKPALASA